MTDEANIPASTRWFVGADKDLRITVYDGPESDTTREVVDITGYSLEFILYDGNTPIITKTTGAGIAITIPIEGVAIVTIEDTDTDAIAGGDYGFELWRTDAGNEDVLSFGTVTLRATKRDVA